MHELVPGARVEGEVRSTGEDIYAADVDPVAVRRQIGMVFQKPNPFPTMSIYDNVAAGLKLNGRKIKKADMRRDRRGERCAARTSGRRSRTDSASPAWACPAASSSASASRGPSR